MELIHLVFSPELPRLGAGTDACTRKAWEILTDLPPTPNILDVGCGTGAPTLELARCSSGAITALDYHQPNLTELEKRSAQNGFNDRITTLCQSMLDVAFPAGSFDVIWCEGAVFIYGFERALEDWPIFLHRGGYLVISELCWFAAEVPEEIRDFFAEIYPPMMTREAIVTMIRTKGLDLLDHFSIPESAWWDELYTPVAARIRKLRDENQTNEEILEMLVGFDREIEMYRKYSQFYGHTFFIMKKS